MDMERMKQIAGLTESVNPISDQLAAQKIFDKIKGTPNLKFHTVEQLVHRYIGMVGKAPTDVKYIATLVWGMLEDNQMV